MMRQSNVKFSSRSTQFKQAADTKDCSALMLVGMEQKDLLYLNACLTQYVNNISKLPTVVYLW